MFRVWGKLLKDNRLIRDITICDSAEDTRTHKVFRALEEICRAFDLGSPIWLDPPDNPWHGPGWRSGPH